MSTARPQWIRCPCSATFQAELFEGLHVSRRPDLREQILDGTFHRFACPSCGEPVVLERRLAYTDFPRRQWFTVHPRIDLRHRDELAAFARRSFELTMQERAPELVQGWAGEMRQRVVFGLASLREKLVIFEAGLDDRFIELLKLQLCQEGVPAMHADAYFHVTAIDSEVLSFEVAPPPPPLPRARDAPRELSVPRERYVMIELQRHELRDHVPWLRDDLVVDYRMLLAPSLPLVPAQGASS